MLIDLDKIIPNPEQPRTVFDDAEMASLAASLEADGLLNPISVEGPHDGMYILLDGERRVRAAKIAGWTGIEANVRPPDGVVPHKRLELALIGNLQRSDMGLVDEARAFQRLVESGYSVAALAEKIGRSITHVYGRLKLLEFPEPVQAAFNADKLPFDPGLVNALRKLSDDQLLPLVKTAAARGLNTRQIQMTAARLALRVPKPKGVRPKQLRVADDSTCPALDLNPGVLTNNKPMCAAVEKTCQACGLYDGGANSVCRECPLTQFIGRLNGEQK